MYYGFKTFRTADIHYFLEFYLEHIFGFIFWGKALYRNPGWSRPPASLHPCLLQSFCSEPISSMGKCL